MRLQLVGGTAGEWGWESSSSWYVVDSRVQSSDCRWWWAWLRIDTGHWACPDVLLNDIRVLRVVEARGRLQGPTLGLQVVGDGHTRDATLVQFHRGVDLGR